MSSSVDGRSRSRSRDAHTRSASRDRMRSMSRDRMSRSRSASRDRGRSTSRDRFPESSRGRSSSRDRLPVGSSRGRSSSPTSRRGGGGGRSSSRDRYASRSRSRSPGQKRRNSREGFEDEPDKRQPRRGKRRSNIGKSMRRLAPAGESCTTMRLCSYVIPIVLIIASSIGLIIATGNGNKITPNALQKIVPTLDQNDLNDPFSGNPDEVPKWDNGGTGGLDVVLQNALQDEWQVVFELAVADWDFGNPDAVSITKERVPYEKDCKPESGKVKVCNGDYGETKWRGINSAVVSGAGFITSSAAKMNEFYLEFDVEGTKQYTMCHEIGHSMGLPHTDESFDNEDLGNCMDYTNNFDDNKHPDSSNYERLTEFYGQVGGRRRGLRRRQASTPDHVLAKFNEVVSKLEQRLDDNAHEDGWRLIHRTKHGEAHEMHLADGYKARVHMLLYNNPQPN